MSLLKYYNTIFCQCQEFYIIYTKTLRKEKNFTQEEIALKLSISAQAVSKWENDISMPDISILTSIADIFDITLQLKTNMFLYHFHLYL